MKSAYKKNNARTMQLLNEEGVRLGQLTDADCFVTCDCMPCEVPTIVLKGDASPCHAGWEL
jgi:hypothetical protein